MTIRIADCAALVAQVSGVPVERLKDHDRRNGIARERMIAYWLARELTGASYAKIARFFGRDHTTVRDGCVRVEEWRNEPGFHWELVWYQGKLLLPMAMTSRPISTSPIGSSPRSPTSNTTTVAR